MTREELLILAEHVRPLTDADAAHDAALAAAVANMDAAWDALQAALFVRKIVPARPARPGF